MAASASTQEIQRDLQCVCEALAHWLRRLLRSVGFRVFYSGISPPIPASSPPLPTPAPRSNHFLPTTTENGLYSQDYFYLNERRG